MKRIAMLLATGLLLGGCASTGTADPDAVEVTIHLKNNTTQPIKIDQCRSRPAYTNPWRDLPGTRDCLLTSRVGSVQSGGSETFTVPATNRLVLQWDKDDQKTEIPLPPLLLMLSSYGIVDREVTVELDSINDIRAYPTHLPPRRVK